MFDHFLFLLSLTMSMLPFLSPIQERDKVRLEAEFQQVIQLVMNPHVLFLTRILVDDTLPMVTKLIFSLTRPETL